MPEITARGLINRRYGESPPEVAGGARGAWAEAAATLPGPASVRPRRRRKPLRSEDDTPQTTTAALSVRR
jgi:hypothetical protein